MQDRQTMIFMNLRSTSKPTGSQRSRKNISVPVHLASSRFLPLPKMRFLENLTHALENIWLSQSKYVIHKEVAISQVFQDNMTYDDLFYMGRFDFVVYEKQGKKELPVLAIELDGKEHFEDAVVQERDRKKNAICQAHNMEIIRVENSYARRYNHIKGILMDYFSRVH